VENSGFAFCSPAFLSLFEVAVHPRVSFTFDELLTAEREQ
jgi:hypothetical protein